jgi:hypothetical protein
MSSLDRRKEEFLRRAKVLAAKRLELEDAEREYRASR